MNDYTKKVSVNSHIFIVQYYVYEWKELLITYRANPSHSSVLTNWTFTMIINNSSDINIFQHLHYYLTRVSPCKIEQNSTQYTTHFNRNNTDMLTESMPWNIISHSQKFVCSTARCIDIRIERCLCYPNVIRTVSLDGSYYRPKRHRWHLCQICKSYSAGWFSVTTRDV